MLIKAGVKKEADFEEALFYSSPRFSGGKLADLNNALRCALEDRNRAAEELGVRRRQLAKLRANRGGWLYAGTRAATLDLVRKARAAHTTATTAALAARAALVAFHKPALDRLTGPDWDRLAD